MPTDIWPVIIENKSSGLGLSQRDMSRITMTHSWEQSSHGPTWSYVEDDHIERLSCPSPHYEVQMNFHQCPGSGRGDQGNLAPYPCPHGPRTFQSSWILLLTSMATSKTESWSSLLSPHVGKLRHAHCSWRGWLWTHQQRAFETSADGSILVPVFRHEAAAVMVRSQSGASVWVTCVISSFYLTSLDYADKPTFSTSSNTCLMIQRGVWSAYDVIMFHECLHSPCVRLLLTKTPQ